MNWHLFLDVVAWSWGIMLNALLVYVIRDYIRHKNKGVLLAATPICFIITLCWTWIIAG